VLANRRDTGFDNRWFIFVQCIQAWPTGNQIPEAGDISRTVACSTGGKWVTPAQQCLDFCGQVSHMAQS
jgi:hypothetical protein